MYPISISSMLHTRQTWLLALLSLRSASGLPTEISHSLFGETIKFGTIGDSWASGVTYDLRGLTNYDDNKSGCMRVNHAYGVQLKDALPFQKKPDFTFAACSGAILQDMAKGQQQLDQVPQDAHFVTVQAGGNDAGFYDMARDCIFHNERGIAYGGQYPDPTGKCATSIATVRRFLDADHDKPGIWKFMDDTIRDIIAHPSTSRRNSKLYVLGYAHLFSTEAPGSDWCNDQSFSVSIDEFGKGKKPVLSNELRTTINDLTTRFNDQVQDVIKNLNNKKVQYVSTTEGFNGHRFCEKGHNLYDQYFGSNVWLWNASPAGLVSADADQTKANDEWSAVYNKTFVFTPGADAFDWSDLLQVKKGPEAKSPHQGWSPGIALRPLHPKLEGHRSIKDSLVPYVMRDFSIASLGLPFFSLEANATTSGGSAAVSETALPRATESVNSHEIVSSRRSNGPTEAYANAT